MEKVKKGKTRMSKDRMRKKEKGAGERTGFGGLSELHTMREILRYLRYSRERQRAENGAFDRKKTSFRLHCDSYVVEKGRRKDQRGWDSVEGGRGKEKKSPEQWWLD